MFNEWPEPVEGAVAIFTLERVRGSGKWIELWIEGCTPPDRSYDVSSKWYMLTRAVAAFEGELDILNQGYPGLVVRWKRGEQNWEIDAVLGRREPMAKRPSRLTRESREDLLEDFREIFPDLGEGTLETPKGVVLVFPTAVLTIYRDRAFDLVLVNDNNKLVQHDPVLGEGWMAVLEEAVRTVVNTELGYPDHEKHCSKLAGRRRHADYYCDCNVTRRKR